jgi:D-ribose pyranose/furanose isomerase RbsD
MSTKNSASIVILVIVGFLVVMATAAYELALDVIKLIRKNNAVNDIVIASEAKVANTMVKVMTQTLDVLDTLNNKVNAIKTTLNDAFSLLDAISDQLVIDSIERKLGQPQVYTSPLSEN